MSSTATTTSNHLEAELEQPSNIRQILRAYEVHQTGADTEQRSGWITELPYAASRRADWDTDRRRIPPYRGPDRSHRLADRPSGRTWGESAFVMMMFSGAYVVAITNKVWINTAGRYWSDQMWRYDVGGEW